MHEIFSFSAFQSFNQSIPILFDNFAWTAQMARVVAAIDKIGQSFFNKSNGAPVNEITNWRSGSKNARVGTSRQRGRLYHPDLGRRYSGYNNYRQLSAWRSPWKRFNSFKIIECLVARKKACWCFKRNAPTLYGSLETDERQMKLINHQERRYKAGNAVELFSLV